MPLKVELRPKPGDVFDELIAEGVSTIHAEMMDKDCLWIGIYGANGEKRWSMWIRAEKKGRRLSVNAFEDG